VRVCARARVCVGGWVTAVRRGVAASFCKSGSGGICTGRSGGGGSGQEVVVVVWVVELASFTSVEVVVGAVKWSWCSRMIVRVTLSCL